jgi:HD-like signal output (HDOD) protein
MTTAASTLPDEIRGAVSRGQVTLAPLPAVATRIQSVLHDAERADPRVVADLVRADPAIAATILRMSNSAYYAGLRPISSVAQAIARLGLHRVGSIVTAAALKDHFATKDPAKHRMFRALWDHAVATAIAARFVAGTDGNGAEEAFLSGLLHDTGKILVLRTVETLEAKGLPKVTPPVLDDLMVLLHPELGHHSLMSWKLPPWTASVALHHHNANTPGSEPLLLRVQVANAVARKIGAHPAPAPDLDLQGIPAVARLRLSDQDLARISASTAIELQTLKSLL